MRKLLLILLAASFAAAAPMAPTEAREGAAEEEFASEIQPFLDQTCYPCHNDRRHRGGINLERFTTAASIGGDPETWDKALLKIRTGEMPPADEPRPRQADLDRVTGWVEQALARADAEAAVDPGRVTIRRLNRAEYNNTIRDLLGVTLRPADDFPQDDSGYGFDNVADVLSLSPVLMEKYMIAAERVARAAIYGVEREEPSLVELRSGPRRVTVRDDVPAEYDETGLSLPNAIHSTHEFPVEAEYLFRVYLGGERPAGAEPVTIALWIDGRQVDERRFDPAGTAGFNDDRQELGGKMVEFRTRVPAGEHWVAASVVKLYEGLPASYGGPNPSRRPIPPPPVFEEKRRLTPEQNARRRKAFEERLADIPEPNDARVSRIEVGGPYDPVGGPSADSREKIYTCGHDDGGHQSWCPTRIVADLARRAFRRPISQAELERYRSLVELAIEEGDPLEEGLVLAIQALLVSPDFLFRMEKDRPAPPGVIAQPLSDHELAARLSYFLWSSMPDARLMQLADWERLRAPGVIEREVRRMLADPKSRALVENFGGQWLQFRALESAAPDLDAYPAFDGYLRRSMRRETELFFERIVREDRSILEFIDGRYTFLNERLARHYGIEGITGPAFRLVSLDTPERSGVMTQGSILTVSSYSTRTSPVLRGKWILENILSTPPPPPPGDIPTLEEAEVPEDASARERLQAHRADPTCAACHRRMDPLGFGLENYDAIGAWRTVDGNLPIDATGELPDGRRFDGPTELKTILRSDREYFARGLAGKLLTYALGRGLERTDRHAVRVTASRVAADDYRFSRLIVGIVMSRPFQMRRAAGVTPPPADATVTTAAARPARPALMPSHRPVERMP